MLTNEEQARKFLEWLSANYDAQQVKLKAFCNDKKYKWDEDIFSNTYLNVHELILRNGLKDPSDKGFDNYLFCSFKTNLKREGQYSRNSKRKETGDLNIKYENWFNATYDSEEVKLKNDLKRDFTAIYILQKVEENFQYEHFYIFRLKFFEHLTYKQLIERTGKKAARTKFLEVKNWLKENVTKKEIDKAFEEKYGHLVY